MAVLIVHHVRKGNGGETTVDSLRGAVSIVDAARSVEMMEAMTAKQGEDFGLAEGRYKISFAHSQESSTSHHRLTKVIGTSA